MAKQIDTIARTLIKFYKEVVPDSGFVIVENNQELGWHEIKNLQFHALRYKMKSFHITDVEPISSDIFAPISWGIHTVKYKKTIGFQDRQGIFKISFSDGDIMYYAKFTSGYGRGALIEGLFATEKKTWYKFKKYIERSRKQRAKPKSGFYKVWSNPDSGLGYTKIDKPSKVETVHPIIPKLNADIKFFFDNVEIFTRYDQPGVRKVMLIGPPGTGKTSMCIKIAREFSSEMPVVVATNLASAAEHLVHCAKAKKRTFIILEDAESSLGSNQGTHSSVLNFLDGVDQPVNHQGSYVIMTTNHPERIEDRILKRPGRIDRIFQVGELEGNYALDCAKLYFEDTLKYTKKIKAELIKSVSGMTGAQIRELANSTKAYAAQNKKELSVSLIEIVKKKLSKDLSDAHRFAEDNSLLDESEQFGFYTV